MGDYKEKLLRVETLEGRVLFSGSPTPAPPPESPPAEEPAQERVDESSPAPAPETDNSQTADPGAAPAETGSEPQGGAVQITTEVVEEVAAAASEIWAASGISVEQQQALNSVSYSISDLGPGKLGSTQGLSITIDDDAAGGGWFVDSTPLENEEFGGADNFGVMEAVEEPAVFGMDLLSILLHEQGHVLGLEDGAAASSALMQGTFAIGERILPDGNSIPDSGPVVEIAYSTGGVAIQNFNILMPGNPNPINPNQLVQGNTYNFVGNVSNTSGDPLTIELGDNNNPVPPIDSQNLGNGASEAFNLQGVFNNSGNFSLFFFAFNSGFTAFDSIDFSVNVQPSGPSANQDPQIIAPDNILTDEDTPVSTSATFDDADSSQLSVNLMSNGPGIQTFNFNSLNGLTSSGLGTNNVTLEGSVSDLNNTFSNFNVVPNQDFFGSDTFTYTITDDTNNTATATVTLSVNPINDAPVISPPNPSVNIEEDQPVNLFGGGGVFNDADGDILNVSLNSSVFTFDPGNVVNGSTFSGSGTNSFSASGTSQQLNQLFSEIVGTPLAEFNGPTFVSINANDGQAPTVSGTVSVTVNPVDDAPEISTGNFTLQEDTPSAAPVGGGILNVSDSDSNSISVTINSSSAISFDVISPQATSVLGNSTSSITVSGTASQVNSALNSMVYTPSANFSGTTTFSIQADDGNSITTNTVTISVNPVNDPPVISIPGLQSTFNTDPLGLGNGLSVQDIDDDILTVEISSGIASNSLLQVNAPADSNGSISGNGTNTISMIGLQGEINNFLNYLTFIPPSGFVGNEQLTISVNDNGGIGDPGTVTDSFTIDITDPPIPHVVPDILTSNEGSGPFTFNPTLNDLYDPGSGISVTNVSPQSALGVLNYDPGSNLFTYTPPDSEFFGTETFTYTIEQTPAPSSGSADSTGLITIEILPINDGPINSVPGSFSATEDEPLDLSGISVSDPDQDYSSQPLDLTVSLSVLNGTLGLNDLFPEEVGVDGLGTNTLTFNGPIPQLNSTLGTVVYTPDQDYFGTDTLTILTSDNPALTGGAPPASDLDTVNITINPVNDGPVIVVPGSQSFFTDFDNRFDTNPFTISDVDAGTNDIQVDLALSDGTLTVTNPPTGVTVTQNSGGIQLTGPVDAINSTIGSSLTYSANNPGFAQIFVTVSDLGNTGPGAPLTDTGTVWIEINNPTPPPTPTPDFNEDGVVDAGDFAIFRNNLGPFNNNIGFNDGNEDGFVDQQDFLLFDNNLNPDGLPDNIANNPFVPFGLSESSNFFDSFPDLFSTNFQLVGFAFGGPVVPLDYISQLMQNILDGIDGIKKFGDSGPENTPPSDQTTPTGNSPFPFARFVDGESGESQNNAPTEDAETPNAPDA